MSLLRTLDSWIERFERFAIAGSILLMAIVSVANVLGRNLLQHSLSYAEEVSQFAIVWVTFVGMSYAARLGVHIRMSALFDLMPRGVRKVMMTIMTLGTGALCFALAWYGYNYLGKLVASGRVSPALRIPTWAVMVWVPLGFFMTGLQYIRTFWKNITNKSVYIAPDLTEEQDDLSSEFMV